MSVLFKLEIFILDWECSKAAHSVLANLISSTFQEVFSWKQKEKFLNSEENLYILQLSKASKESGILKQVHSSLLS